VTAELEAHDSLTSVIVLCDAADALESESVEALERARVAGARLVLVGGERWAENSRDIEVPPLDERAAIDLVRRAVPSLTDKLQKRVVAASGGYPGELRRLVRLIATDAVASPEDIERKLGATVERVSESRDPLERALRLLDRGRFTEAKATLALLASDGRVAVSVARARLDLGLGEPARALAGLRASSEMLEGATEAERQEHALYRRRHRRLRRGAALLSRSLPPVQRLPEKRWPTRAGAFALGRHDEARARLVESEKVAGRARIAPARALRSPVARPGPSARDQGVRRGVQRSIKPPARR
jgi:hypothetical protein